MARVMIGTLLFLLALPVRAGEEVLQAEVLEGSYAVEVPGTAPSEVRYLVLHHKRQNDQARLAEWLRQHGGARMSFRTLDGTPHAAVLQRLKHCFGRGLLLYADAVDLHDKDVIELRLPTSE